MSEENKVPYTFSKDYIDKQLSSIRNMLDYRNYSLVSGLVNVSGDIYRPRRINRSVLRKALENPFFASNIDVLQQASTMLKATNGIYKRVLNLSANMHTNDYMIYPLEVDKIKDSSKMQKAYMECAKHTEKLGIKDNACWIKERVLEQGELYVYLIEDAKGVVLQEIPSMYCRITSIEDNVQKFGVNLKKINDKNVKSFPLEIQQAWTRYVSGRIKEEDLEDKAYYELKDNAVAFSLDKFSPKGVPFYSTIFDDLMELEDMKDLKSQNAVIESIKLIHQQFPIDEETGHSLIDFDVITQYHNATKQTLPKGTAVTTNPLKLQAVSLGDSNSKINNNVAQAKDIIFDSAGINAEIFNGSKNSNEAIAMGIVADGLVVKPLNAMISNWINYELRKKKMGGFTWRVRFLDTTEFNKEKSVKLVKENLAFGGSKLEFLSVNGYTPLQGLSVLKMESVLGLDELLVPQASSHTQSGDKGRTSKADGGSGDDTTTTPLAE